MNVKAIVKHLQRAGIQISADGGALHYDAPKGALTPALREELLKNKRLLLEHLQPATNGKESNPEEAVANQEEHVPLSFSQERIWFLTRLDPDSSAYTVPLAVRISGQLNVLVLEQAFSELIRRNEILRTVCSATDGQLAQVVVEPGNFFLPVVDLSGLAEGVQVAEVLRMANEETQRPFDLTVGPMLRLKLLRLAENEHVLVLTIHLFVCDGWSFDLLLQQVADLYRDIQAGSRPQIPENSFQYSDYARWQRQSLQGGLLDTQLSYWRQQLAGVSPVLHIPTDRPRSTARHGKSAVHSFEFSDALSQHIRSYGLGEGVTPFVTLLTALQTLLHRYSGQDDVVVTTVVSNRNRIETEEMLGSCANNLLLRSDFSECPTFQEMVGRVQETVTSAFAHQDVPLEMVAESLRGINGTIRIPESQVMFVYHQADALTNLRIPGLAMERIPVEVGSGRVELNLVVVDDQSRFNCTLTYNAALFDQATISKMVRDLAQVLETVVANPHIPISDIKLMVPVAKGDHETAVSLEALATLDPGRSEPATTLGDHHSEMESLISKLWTDILGLDTVSPHDNFFDLGGHSLLAMQVISKLEKATHLKIDPSRIMLQTLGQLATDCEARIGKPQESRPKGLTKTLSAWAKHAFPSKAKGE